jgi:hypothetical protein
MPEPTDLIRVKVKDTGHKFTTRQSVVDADPDTYQVLKQDAVDHNGAVLPPEYPGESSPSSAPVVPTIKES